MKKKRHLFRGPARAFPRFHSLPITDSEHCAAWWGKISTPFPFVSCFVVFHLAIKQQKTSLRQSKLNTQDRLTHGEALFPWNLSPRQSSTIPVESLLLPPRSALCAVPLELTLEALQLLELKNTHALLHIAITIKNLIAMAEFRSVASASSIFRARPFGR